MGLNGTRRTLAIIALLVGVITAAAACSSGSGKKVSLNAGSGATSGASSGTTTSPATGSTGPAAAGPGSTTPAAAGSTTAPAHSGTTAAPRPGGTTGTTAPPANTGPKATTPASTGPAPVAPGTYHYNLVSGTSTLTTGTTSTPQTVAPTSTLVVSGSGGSEQWVNPTTTSMFAFNSAGVFLVSETLANTTCVFSPAVASPPWPLVVGKQFTGRATCGSGSSASTLTLEGGKVLGTATLPLDGAMVPTYMVQSTLKLTGTDLVVGETDWYSPALRMPVKTAVSVHGSVSGYAIDTTTTYILASARPS